LKNLAVSIFKALEIARFSETLVNLTTTAGVINHQNGNEVSYKMP
jgi:hypothetical protein